MCLKMKIILNNNYFRLPGNIEVKKVTVFLPRHDLASFLSEITCIWGVILGGKEKHMFSRDQQSLLNKLEHYKYGFFE